MWNYFYSSYLLNEGHFPHAVFLRSLACIQGRIGAFGTRVLHKSELFQERFFPVQHKLSVAQDWKITCQPYKYSFLKLQTW